MRVSCQLHLPFEVGPRYCSGGTILVKSGQVALGRARLSSPLALGGGETVLVASMAALWTRVLALRTGRIIREKGRCIVVVGI